MNDDRPIEKLLRRYATKRREAAGEPLELHPATRRLLQGEVSRQFPKAGAEGNSAVAGWFTVFRQRWVYAAAALGLLLIAGVMLVMNGDKSQLATAPPKFELAKNEMSPAKAATKEVRPQEREADAARGVAVPAPVSASAPEPAPSRPAAAAPSARGNDKRPRASAPTLAKKAPQAIAPLEAYASAVMTNQSGSAHLAAKPVSLAPAAAFAEERNSLAVAAQDQSASLADSSVRLDSKITANTLERRSEPATGSVAFETQSGVPASARYGFKTQAKTAAVSQSFANQAPIPVTKTTRKAAPASPVLANFQMEQAGDQLRVIDGDGSIYVGDLNPAPASYGGGSKDAAAFKQGEKLALRRSAAPAAAAPPPAQNYFYRVAGTNRTLNQQVEFTWQFVELTNQQAKSKGQVVGDALKQDSLVVPQQFPALLQNSAINGRAQINAAKEIEINAVPVKP